jgi:hypothetical protein
MLAHTLTQQQQQLWDDLTHQAKRYQLANSCARQQFLVQLDRSCLRFCISLLDHRLKGSLFDSVALGFLAVLGIDLPNQTLHSAQTYTPKLSRFIKIAQLLMVQRALLEVEEGHAEYPSDILEEMCGRFMLDNTSSPLAWAIQLRTFGKKIQTATTTQGFITWSEDQQTLAYRDLELTMSHFKAFVAQQVKLAQAALRRILLLHKEEDVVQVVPRLPLHEIKDNPANVTYG